MEFLFTSKDYVAYLKRAAEKIASEGAYITALDAETGDGDHWANINMGFSHLVSVGEELEALPMDALLKKVGMLMMNKVGGSSGILYGGAYVAAAKKLSGTEALDWEKCCCLLETMTDDMMSRGKSQVGYKTMIDSIAPAAAAFRKCICDGIRPMDTVAIVRAAALDGAEATRNMEAVKGRASYRLDKGVGHLDPGAVTMSYQLACLCDCLLEKLTVAESERCN